jgi:hypothetical protein
MTLILSVWSLRGPSIIALGVSHSGPATVEMFRDLWRKQVTPGVAKTHRAAEQGQLFK